MRKGYYITNTSFKEQDPACDREEMELVAWLYREWPPIVRESRSAYMNGNRTYSSGNDINAEDGLAYMADYVFDENDEITEVHYDPVPVRYGQ